MKSLCKNMCLFNEKHLNMRTCVAVGTKMSLQLFIRFYSVFNSSNRILNHKKNFKSHYVRFLHPLATSVLNLVVQCYKF